MATWRQNPAVAIVAGVILVGAIILTVVLMQPSKVTFALKCESCNTEFQAKLPQDTIFPVACPSCGKKTAYQAVKMRCKACAKTFVRLNKPIVPSSGNLAEKVQPGVKCPHCGAQGQLEVVK